MKIGTLRVALDPYQSPADRGGARSQLSERATRAHAHLETADGLGVGDIIGALHPLAPELLERVLSAPEVRRAVARIDRPDLRTLPPVARTEDFRSLSAAVREAFLAFRTGPIEGTSVYLTLRGVTTHRDDVLARLSKAFVRLSEMGNSAPSRLTAKAQWLRAQWPSVQSPEAQPDEAVMLWRTDAPDAAVAARLAQAADALDFRHAFTREELARSNLGPALSDELRVYNGLLEARGIAAMLEVRARAYLDDPTPNREGPRPTWVNMMSRELDAGFVALSQARVGMLTSTGTRLKTDILTQLGVLRNFFRSLDA